MLASFREHLHTQCNKLTNTWSNSRKPNCFASNVLPVSILFSMNYWLLWTPTFFGSLIFVGPYSKMKNEQNLYAWCKIKHSHYNGVKNWTKVVYEIKHSHWEGVNGHPLYFIESFSMMHPFYFIWRKDSGKIWKCLEWSYLSKF